MSDTGRPGQTFVLWKISWKFTLHLNAGRYNWLPNL